MSERDSPAVLAYRVGTLEISVKEGLKELGGKLDSLTATFATQQAHNELKARVAKLETRNNVKNTLLWVGLVASAIINIIGAAHLFGIK